MSDEKRPWWEIEDEVRMTTDPRDPARTTPSLSYIIAVSTWRKLSWPDRPHP